MLLFSLTVSLLKCVIKNNDPYLKLNSYSISRERLPLEPVVICGLYLDILPHFGYLSILSSSIGVMPYSNWSIWIVEGNMEAHSLHLTTRVMSVPFYDQRRPDRASDICGFYKK